MGEFREDVNNDRNGGARFETTGRDKARKRTEEEACGLKERFAGSKLRNGEILREKTSMENQYVRSVPRGTEEK